MYAIDFASTETAATVKANGVEPELGFHVFPFNVDMGRLVPVAGVEEKPVRPFYRYSRHGKFSVTRSQCRVRKPA